MYTQKEKKKAPASEVQTILAKRLHGKLDLPPQCGPRYTPAIPFYSPPFGVGGKGEGQSYPTLSSKDPKALILSSSRGVLIKLKMRRESETVCRFKNLNSILIIACYNLCVLVFTYTPLPASQTKVLNHHQPFMGLTPPSQLWPLLQRALLIKQKFSNCKCINDSQELVLSQTERIKLIIEWWQCVLRLQ